MQIKINKPAHFNTYLQPMPFSKIANFPFRKQCLTYKHSQFSFICHPHSNQSSFNCKFLNG